MSKATERSCEESAPAAPAQSSLEWGDFDIHHVTSSKPSSEERDCSMEPPLWEAAAHKAKHPDHLCLTKTMEDEDLLILLYISQSRKLHTV